MDNSDTFETEDLALSAYLVMIDVPMLSHRSKGSHLIFTFQGEDFCNKAHIDFINSKFRKYDSAIRDLKKLIKRPKK